VSQNALLAQNIIEGKVFDDSNQPLIGVSIQDQLTGVGTVSEIDGSYAIELLDTNTSIVFSYLGYKSVTLFVSDAVSFDVVMIEDGVTMDEIVVTGMNIKRQKRELGYSTDNIAGEEIAISNAPNILNALSGRSAGVNINSANGVDGGTTRITIRGNNNITGDNQPLIIVDGVPIENPPGLTQIGRGTDWGSAINNINADDIEDVSILKGPTASAKYGMRGANGVILITTKKGKKGNGLGVEYIFTHKIIQPYRFRKVQNKYGAGGPISLLDPTFQTNADGEFIYPKDVHSNNGPFGRPTTEQFGFYSTGVSWGPQMQGQQVRWWDGELRTYDPQPDNLGLFFNNGTTSTHNVNMSNGGAWGTMRASFTYQGHNAVVPNSNFDQYTVNFGSRLNISDKLSTEITLSYINFNRKNSPSLGDDNNSSFGKGILYSWPRSYKGLEKDLNIHPDGTRFNYDGNYPFQFTPRHLWWNTYNQNTYLTRNKMIGSVGINYNPTSWLNAAGRIGIDFNLNEFERRFNPVDAIGISEALYGNELDRNKVLNGDLIITASKTKLFRSKVNASLSVGGTQWSRSQYGINATTDQWQNPWLFSFNNFQSTDPDRLPLAREIRFDKKINSIYSFVNLSYDNFLFLELSGRNDWSSALPLANNSYFYPSASVSYILSENINFSNSISFVKLRAAYAKTASDTDPFLLDFVYDIGVFGNQQTASLPAVKPPLDLKPQQADSYEIGTSIGLFDDKISLDLTYYYIQSFDQILESPVPTSSGAANIRINNGILENYGFEVNVTANLLERPWGYLNMGLNFSQNRNYVRSLGDGAQFLEIANIWGDFGPKIMVQENEEYGTIYGYDYVRHPDNGQPMLNEEGTHYQITENLVPVGNASPDIVGGWTLAGKYKNWSFSTLVDAKIGGDIYAGSYVIGRQTGQSPSTLIERDGGGLPYTDPSGEARNVGVVLPGVYENGVENDKVVHYYYKYLPNAGGWGKILTTPGILDNTWLKMREIRLNYEVPSKAVKRLKVFNNLQLSVVGRDLFYLYTSLPDNVNPEGISGSGNAQGLEWAALPSMRSFSFRITTKF
jgi:iron complex outermembrane receptor protein